MSAMTETGYTSQVLDHLGLVSATIERLGLVDRIDKRLPLDTTKGAKVNMGTRVAAMILNGLGFIDDRLYMFPDFLANKPIELLLGKGLEAKDFNDDMLGRCLDSIHDYGTSKLFSELSFEIGRKLGLLGRSSHVDTTTLSLYGNYEKNDEAELTPAYGYSKQKRMDLKQVVLLLATTGKGNLPLWMASHNGNASDQKSLHEAAQRIESFNQQLKDAPSFIHIADSAMYQSCVKEATKLRWLSRVPERIKEAKTLVQTPESEIEWLEIKEDYKISPRSSTYGGVQQRWLLVYSKQAYERENKTFNRRLKKEHEEQTKAIFHLGAQRFKCAADAELATKQFTKTLKHYCFEPYIEPIMGHKSKGRPKKGAEPEIIGYQVRGELKLDTAMVEKVRSSKGRFILATNELSKSELSDLEILTEYKNQSQVETGFKFIKDDTFELSSVFLKKPERIDALMMIMALCLMVYNLAQHHLHTMLRDENDTLPNQLKKQVQNPSMKWVFRMFQGVHVLCVQMGSEQNKLVLNLNDDLIKVIKYFGSTALDIYMIENQSGLSQ